MEEYASTTGAKVAEIDRSADSSRPGRVGESGHLFTDTAARSKGLACPFAGDIGSVCSDAMFDRLNCAEGLISGVWIGDGTVWRYERVE